MSDEDELYGVVWVYVIGLAFIGLIEAFIGSIIGILLALVGSIIAIWLVYLMFISPIVYGLHACYKAKKHGICCFI